MGLEMYMKCFWDLCGDRPQQGMRITWSTVDRWCEVFGLDREERHDVHFLIGRMDIAYLNWQNKKPLPEKEKKSDPRRVRKAHQGAG